MAPHCALLVAFKIVELVVEFASNVACVGMYFVVTVVVSAEPESVAIKTANVHMKSIMKAENAIILGVQIYLSLLGIIIIDRILL